MVNGMLDALGTAGTFITTLALANSTDPMVNLLCAVVSAVVFWLLNVLAQVIVNVLKKKGLITDEQAKDLNKDLKDKIEDIQDDGKLNNSNEDKD